MIAQKSGRAGALPIFFFFKYTYGMNNITKLPLDSLGYNFIKKQYLPKGKDEYYLRNLQNRTGTK